MTGEGNRNFEQIKAARSSRKLSAIDLHCDYRTANGCRVRGLQREHSGKTVIAGSIVMSAELRPIIRGQVYMRNPNDNNHFSWTEQVWECDGSHIINDQLNLMAYKPESLYQPTLFQNI